MDRKKEADFLYLLLAGLFIGALVVCNLIANKFITIDLGFREFVISAGVLPYPITFLITDILSEIYGRKKTTRVVIVGFVVSLFVLGILLLGGMFNAIEGSPVSDELYDQTFNSAWRVVGASMLAYLFAQMVDVRIFHFWKRLTNGKHLWLRNNFSTIFSQWIDTTLVVVVLFIGIKPMCDIATLIIDGWLFKSICALVDTPIFYGVSWYLKKRFGLKENEEISD